MQLGRNRIEALTDGVFAVAMIFIGVDAVKANRKRIRPR
jgi:hypothetical protein